MILMRECAFDFPLPFFLFQRQKETARSSPRTGFFPFLLFQEECHKPKVQSATRSDRRETSKHGGNVVHFFLKRIPPPLSLAPRGKGREGEKQKTGEAKRGVSQKGER
jgi:hypothetical protein